MFGGIMSIAGFSCAAQDVEVQQVVKQFPKANAVIWDHTEHLTLRYDGSGLKARSDINRETLLLNDQATGIYNTASVYHGFLHTLGHLDATTAVPNGDRYKTIKATEYRTTHSETESIFYDDAKETQVTFSNLSRFARTRVNYSMTHDDVHFMPAFYFQSFIPTRNASYSVTAPKSVRIGYKLQGLHTDLVHFTREEGRNDVTYTWSTENMPQATSFSDAPNSSYTIPHVLVYVAEYKAPWADSVTRVLSSVADLYHYYYPFVQGVNIQPNEEISGLVANITAGAANQREKAARIYQWVQQNMRYVAYEDSMGGYIPRPAATVCSRRFGDCKDMTSLLVAMCRTAGLTASFTWIGTRALPYHYNEVPLPITDNHMICAVMLDGKWVLMDGTDRVIPFGIPPYGLQGKEALIAVDANKYEINIVPVASADNNVIIDSTTLSISGGSTDLVGDVSIRCMGYGAWRMAAVLQYSNETEKDKLIRRVTARGSNKYKQQSFHYLPGNNDYKSCELQSHFILGDYARKVGNEWYVNLNLQRTYANDYVDTASREVPVEYDYRQHQREVVILKVPAGYTVTYLPPDKSGGEPGLWKYSLHYEQKGAEVKLVKELTLDTLLVTPSQFAAHNHLVESLLNEYKESVVLTNK
jgi:transglutaminase-like putative cysteine protease